MWSVLQERVYRTKISDVDELKRRINSELAAVGEWLSVYALAFVLVLEVDILSTCCNKDCDVTRVTFLRDNNNQSCL